MKKWKKVCKWVPMMLSWWLILFPEMVFCSGMCTAYQLENEGGNPAADGTSEGELKQVQMDSETLRELLFRTEPEQIAYRSFLWEMLSQTAKGVKE